MSENFNQKDYGEYFKTLEERLNKPSAVRASVTKTPPKTQTQKGVWCVFRIKPAFVAIVLAVIVVITSVSVIAVATSKNQRKSDVTSEEAPVQAEKQEEKKVLSYSEDENTVEIPSANDAKNAIIINKTDKKIVAQRNAHERIYPASTTKIMTLLVAVENLTNLDDTFTITLAITDPLFVRGASVAGFLNNETVTMYDLLYGLILPSGADAAVALAIKIAGSEEAFVEMMNAKVAELELKNTHFANVSGLFDQNNYSSAYDMAIILETALQNELCKTILSTKKYTTSKTPQNPDGILLSSTLFDYMKGTEPETATVFLGKTGYINESGYCIASYGKNNTTDKEYIIVTMGNSARRVAFSGQIDLYKEFAK